MNNFINQTLGEIVAKQNNAVPVLEKYNLDYCCRGKRTLQKACEENNQRAGEEMTDREHGGGNKIDYEAEEREEIRVYARSGERTDNLVQQPLASFSDAACERSHTCFAIRRDEPGTISIDCAFGVLESYTSGAIGRKPATLDSASRCKFSISAIGAL